ncbi:enoyl-CoA hydratase/isomerase family protein [Nocardioides panacisoli]|uniref:enoyl-CoA hydratase/isomerase family protein n=1 Tax=Nocardioides panacisoli TaxID=627624 RepID=UPI001C6304A7|nr:enoyl-CoA hydratase-related protein [Nocardioides panacisoli]QYJ03701.1 enoyl-CoA hydratase/isomerase family protein [Nocardioides panacisoli]
MSEHESVRYHHADGCARITLTNPSAGNPLTPESGDALLAAILQAKADAARVIVLAAEGRFFSVGGALDGFAEASDPKSHLLELAEGAHRIVTELKRCDAVVVSVVQGTAAGVGFPLSAAADIVLAADSAQFSLAYAKVGLSPDGGGTLLVNTLGMHRTLRLAILGDLLSAQEAHAAGLLARVVPAEELEATAEEVVATLLAGSRDAQVAAKHLIRDLTEPAAESALRREAESISHLGSSPSGQEGISAFVEKRAPTFH